MSINDDPLTCAARDLFGLSYLFPYQRLVVTNILEAAANEEACGYQIVILPTGAGKSLCFQMPAMLLEGITLVIYPILSLMADQERRLREKDFAPVILRGEQSKEERDAILQKLESSESRFIIANPEILLTEQARKLLEKIKITHIVIDEAHCVSEWGESFRPSYLEIGSIVKSLNPPLVTAFTATASSAVLEKIKKYIFGTSRVHQIAGNPDRPNIYYSAKGCISRNLAVRDLIIKNERPAIVFCSSRPGTEKLAHYLRSEFSEMGFSWHSEIKFYHAGLSKEEKEAIEKWFFNNNEGVLCATCAYGLGVDKADVRTVIHRDCAPSVEAYLQESGRAGRDGKQSKAFLLFGPLEEDKKILERAKTVHDRARIETLLHYAKDSVNCRRHSLLKMLDYDSGGEVPEGICCDVCEKEADTELREEAALVEFFRKNKRRFTFDEAVSVLAESKTVRWSQNDTELAISHLLQSGKIEKANKFFWKSKLTVKSL